MKKYFNVDEAYTCECDSIQQAALAQYAVQCGLPPHQSIDQFGKFKKGVWWDRGMFSGWNGGPKRTPLTAGQMFDLITQYSQQVISLPEGGSVKVFKSGIKVTHGGGGDVWIPIATVRQIVRDSL